MKHHALLIGIDAYVDHKPLRGCVNDLDAVQRILLDGLGIPPDDIIRLDAPLPDTTHDTRVPRADATLDHIEAALARLASPAVERDDRVFIYFSGHGWRRARAAGGRATQFEALVPMNPITSDGTYRLLFDHQLNRRLADIVARTRFVSVVLDCCFGAGVTRDRDRPRFLELPADARFATERGAAASQPLARGVADCHVVAACLAHETSCEKPEGSGAYGVFTRAFTRAVASARSDPRTLTWAEIWQPMLATVEQLNPAQHAWMEGCAARAVFGGPPVDRDPGFAVRRDGDDYRVSAGSLADVTPGTVLGVYGPDPAFFYWLDSQDDLKTRLGELVVTSAELGTAIARPREAAFALPADARARILQSGAWAGLRYAVADQSPPAMRDGLAGSQVLEQDANAIVRLVHHADHWFITDDVHGTGPEGDGRPVLFAIPAAAAAHAHRVLEHYATYARPIAMARRLAGAGEHQLGGLALRVLRCPPGARSPSSAYRAGLPESDGGLAELATSTPGAYTLTEGDAIVFVVDNTTDKRLRVALFDAAASGRVILIADQSVGPGEHLAFWHPQGLGIPFSMDAPDDGRALWAERMIAIGRTEQGSELHYLKQSLSLRDALGASITASSSRPQVGRTGSAGRWTAAEATLTVRKR